ncbi:MAG: menaquinone biosynthesis protein [Planctomycetes bacterium]|jgi:chorismate dehydratase|nr:menaquinone biosynthesis protein [Planctomycetota bacterium]
MVATLKVMTTLEVQPKTMARLETPDSSVRVGVVSFLNARPLVAGLEQLRNWVIHPAPPSQLIDLVANDEVDLALCSSVDLLTAPFEPAWLASTPLGCCGATQTVRLFTRGPVENVSRIHCDTDSHTSVALLRILLAEYWGISAELVPLGDGNDVEAKMLIGDKVVDGALTRDAWPVQVDLGEAWFDHVGLPFVFAVWMGKASNSRRIQRAGRVIDRQFRLNRTRIGHVVSQAATDLGWSEAAATKYLGSHIRYTFGDREMDGLQAFLARCRTHAVADRDVPAPMAL